MIKVASEAAQILIAKAFDAGQGHVLAHWDALDAAGQSRLLATIKEIDFQELQHLITRCVKGSAGRKMGISKPQPAEAERAAPGANERAELRKLGEEALRRGEIAVFMAAGMHGAHIGLSGPEGMCPVGAISQKTLFQLHAEQIAALNRGLRTEIPFLVMTSTDTDEETQAFFKANHHFILPPRSVTFLSQPRLPIVDRRGKILMKSESEIAMAPNGHGGAFLLMREPALLEHMRTLGVKHVFYFQVNNPFVHVADQEFIGRHVRGEAEISVRYVRKERPDERVGVFIRRGEQVGVIEYSDLSETLRKARVPGTGELMFAMGNIAVHIFSCEFLERSCREEIRPPYHLTNERVPCLNRKGGRVQPAVPNCMRFESYVFDVFPMAKKLQLIAADRADEFYPVNASRGACSPEEVQRAMSDRYARWLVSAGVTLPRDEAGIPSGTYEISPLFARDIEELKEKLDASTLVAGDSLYLE